MSTPQSLRKRPAPIIVATDAQLQRRSHIRRLAMATVSLGYSRRLLINVMADTLYHYDGAIIWRDGRPYDLPEIDDVFGDDPSFRWLSSFLKFAVEPPRQAAQTRVIERLRMIDLHFRIAHTDIAKRIAR